MACAVETLAETEAWVIDPEKFGALYQPACATKADVIVQIKGRIAALEEQQQQKDVEAAAQRERDAELAREREAIARQRRLNEEAAERQREEKARLDEERAALEAAKAPPPPPEPDPVVVADTVPDPVAEAAAEVEHWVRPSDAELADAVAQAFNVPEYVARDWLGFVQNAAQERAA